MAIGIHLPFTVGVSPTLHIRGIIATEKIAKDQEIERCPAIIFPLNDHADHTIFANYVFGWDATHEALALGYGSLMNHANEPSVEVDFDVETKEIIFTAKHVIKAGEELTIHYHDGSEEPVPDSYFSYDKEMEA